MIALRDVRFTRPDGGFALQVDALDIDAGDSVALIGPSGSGKTTLLEMLGGVLVPDAGQVRVSGADLAVMSDPARRAFRRTHVGYVFQSFELLDYLSVLENILLPVRLGRIDRDRRTLTERARELAEQTGLSHALGRSVTRLSQGERQRVAVCRALLLAPKLVLADEPTGNLDGANKDAIFDLLLDACAREGATLVVATHDVERTGRFARSLAVAGGRLAS